MEKSRPADRTRPRRTRSRTPRGLPGITAGVALLIVITLTISTFADAAHAATTTVKAPYKNSSVSYPQSAATTGCGSAKLTVPANWSPTTGIGKFAAKNTASICKGYFGTSHLSSSSNSLTTFMVAIPVHPGHVTSSIQTTWLTQASVTQAIAHSGTCSSVTSFNAYGNGTSECYVDDSIEIYSIIYLVDTTSGATYYGTPLLPVDVSNSSSWQKYDVCTYHSCTPYSYSTGASSGGFHLSTTNTSYINGSFNPTDHYVLVSEVSGYIVTQAGFSGTPTTQPGGNFGGSATVSINMATGGNLTTLKSIVLV
jgi:hypothetical protein